MEVKRNLLNWCKLIFSKNKFVADDIDTLSWKLLFWAIGLKLIYVFVHVYW